jgi:Domain of unknown function (DUF4160)
LPEILRKDGFVVCIYCELGSPHHLPHCHVRWGDQAAVVSLVTLRFIAGDDIPPSGVQILVENIDLLLEKWEQLNVRVRGKTDTKTVGEQAGKK